jgi:surfeit locus 1 family protein
LVYAAASAFRPDASGPGYWVFTPARLAGNRVVVVNRGFVPEGRREVVTRAVGEIRGPVEIVGVMRWPESRSWFSPADDPHNNLWFTRDPLAIAAAKGLPAVAPFYVEQESPEPPGGLPRPGKIVPNLRNEHLQYALTWFGLALVLAVAFGFWAFGSAGEDSRGNAPRQP